MGSLIQINDTLQITTEQGFPSELDLNQHLIKPFAAADFQDRIFEFKNKSKVRIYQATPNRAFLAHNQNGKWLLWGLIEILELTLDLVNQTTSGKYKIITIYSPDQMRQAEDIVFNMPDIKYFANKK